MPDKFVKRFGFVIVGIDFYRTQGALIVPCFSQILIQERVVSRLTDYFRNLKISKLCIQALLKEFSSNITYMRVKSIRSKIWLMARFTINFVFISKTLPVLKINSTKQHGNILILYKVWSDKFTFR